VTQRDGGVADTFEVAGLANGTTYYFRTQFIGPGRLPSLPSSPIVAVPGPTAIPLQSIENVGTELYESTVAWSPSGDRIAFVRSTGAAPRISIMDVPSLAETSLNPRMNSAYMADLAWSPDGRNLSCTSGPTQAAGDLDYRIWLVPIDGSAPHSVSPGRVDFGAAWGESEELLVYCRGTQLPPNVPEIYRSQLGVSEDPVAITQSTQLLKFRPSLRGSDQLIAFEGEPLGRATPRRSIYAVPLAGGAIRDLIVSPWDDAAPSWSPDGKRLAFTSWRSGHADIWIYDVAARSARPLTTGTLYTISARRASWSSDGSRIAVTEARRDGTQRIDLYAAP
jgi:Tol biopolymer transport system component